MMFPPVQKDGNPGEPSKKPPGKAVFLYLMERLQPRHSNVNRGILITLPPLNVIGYDAIQKGGIMSKENSLNTLKISESTPRSFIDGLNLTLGQINNGHFVEMTFFSFTAKGDSEMGLNAQPNMVARAEFIARTDIETLKGLRDQLNDVINGYNVSESE